MVKMREVLEARREREAREWKKQEAWAKFVNVMALVGGTLLGAVGLACVIILAKSVCQAVAIVATGV